MSGSPGVAFRRAPAFQACPETLGAARSRAVAPTRCSTALEHEAAIDGHTTNLTVVDGEGNACVLTSSLGLGSGDWLPGLDLHLNSMLGETDLVREPLRPGARMASMMAPTLVFDDDGLELAIGAAGGTRLRTALVGVLAAVLHEGRRTAGGDRPAPLPSRRARAERRARRRRAVARPAGGARPRGAALARAAPLLRRRQRDRPSRSGRRSAAERRREHYAAEQPSHSSRAGLRRSGLLDVAPARSGRPARPRSRRPARRAAAARARPRSGRP